MQETMSNQEIEFMEQELLPKHAQDIELQLYTTQERGWPQHNFTIDNLVTGIHHNKYTYTGSNYSEADVLDFIKNREIKLHGWWNNVSKYSFGKIRTGIMQERSPVG